MLIQWFSRFGHTDKVHKKPTHFGVYNNYTPVDTTDDKKCSVIIPHFILSTSLDNTVVRQIGFDQPNKNDYNILIFQYKGEAPENLSSDDWHPFKNLNLEILKWLQQHPFVHIVFLSTNEAKIPYGLDYTKLLGGVNVANNVINMSCRFNGGVVNLGGIVDLPGVSFLQCVIPSWLDKHTLLKSTLSCGTSGVFKKKVLNYTGKLRYSRAMLHMVARQEIDKENFMYSLRASNVRYDKDDQNKHLDLTWDINTTYKFITSENTDTRPPNSFELFKEFYNLKTDFNVFDEGDIRTNFFRILEPQVEDYRVVFCDLVSETFGNREVQHLADRYKGDIVFMTEKIMKPILCRRPFIVQANSGYLKMLKQLGFKTFDLWWDESYDENINLWDSLNIIRKNLKYINSMTYSDIYKIYKDMLPTLEHNRQVMIEHIYDNDRTHLTSLQKYFDTCYDRYI